MWREEEEDVKKDEPMEGKQGMKRRTCVWVVLLDSINLSLATDDGSREGE